ncbi:unnamed protein product [Caenorhabditis bovis]|uniref:Uncharacterized protein n=1 Tax=Caenorhabditis bovis TaxID=2654633 RepID=A0A8S1EN82_9PELO|nr:unnamed protein product [Caenorhabditis bovis]
MALKAYSNNDCEMECPVCCVLTCPNNTLPFDYQACDPQLRSQCPAGFTCREARDEGATGNLCCESGTMTIGDWLAEKKITPDILPTAPFSLITRLQLAPINSNLNFPPIHIGDEIVVLSFADYQIGIVESLRLAAPAEPGFYHVLTMIDAPFKPFAFYFNYNIASTATGDVLNVTSSQQFLAFVDNSTIVPGADAYRHQYLVLVYYTPAAISFNGNSADEMLLGSCNDARCMFASSPFASRLNQPNAATLFYLTTKKSVFATSTPPDSAIAAAVLSPILVVFVFSLLW